MKLERGAINGIKFYHRKGFSDLKTLEEVIGHDCYQKRGLKIQEGQRWMDCGGNVGAFALLACSKNASVEVYEPDPFNCEMIERNLKLNGFRAKIHQAALVHDDRESAVLFIGNNNNVWRNSLMKKWNDKGLRVPCLNFDEEVKRKGFTSCKMDIEGAEMPILENSQVTFDHLVYEWSLDIDPFLPRLWKLLERQIQQYRVEAEWKRLRYFRRDYEFWPRGPSGVWLWFPCCTNVFCFKPTGVT